MDDAINTNTWGQVTTFMDIIGPRSDNSIKRAPPAKSHTLMREAVKRPEIAKPRAQVSDFQTVRPNLTATAALTDRSPLISRFSPNSEYQQESPPSERIEPMEVRQYPSMEQGPMPESQDPYVPPVRAEATAAALEPPNLNIFKDPLPGTFEYSRAPAVKRESKWSFAKKVSGWSVLAVAAIGVIGAGVYINSNFNKLELYVASSRAGFTATLPNIKTGYSLSGISTGGGVIEASFKSSTNQSYSISEKKSGVDSTQLLASYVTDKAGLNFQTINTSGNTIYVYNGHDATWAKNGIWYVLQDNNNLNNQQIVAVVNSM